MLKRRHYARNLYRLFPAAFRRLCVETVMGFEIGLEKNPAAFRRLCVETETETTSCRLKCCQPPSGGCVLKPDGTLTRPEMVASRLQAAVF